MKCQNCLDEARFEERAKIELVRSAHGVGEANFHVVLVPAYRKPIFSDPEVRKLTLAYLRFKFAQFRIVVVLAEFGPDHLHMFLANVVSVGICAAIGLAKGYSSRRMRERHWHLFRRWLWGKKFWTAGKFYRSVGAVNAERALRYIATAESRHFEKADLEAWVSRKETNLKAFGAHFTHSQQFHGL